MNTVLLKFGIPCGIVLLLGLLPPLLSFTPQPSYQIDAILHDIAAAENSTETETRLNLHLSFLERIANPDDLLFQQSITSMRYQAGQQFAERNDAAGLEAALWQYQQIETIDPAYNHGWLQFLLGDTYQKLERWDEAAAAYESVPFYNHSRLALRAKFLELMIRSEQLEQPVSSQDVYHYLRFASEYPFSDALMASKWQWIDENNRYEHTHYINALAEYELGNKETALELINNAGYVPGTGYYRDLFENRTYNTLYPVNNDLLQSSFYKGSIISGELMMEEGKSLFTVYYVGIDRPEHFRLELHYDHIPAIHPEFEIILNSDKALELTYYREQKKAWIDFHPHKGRNLVEIRWFNSNPSPSTASQPNAAMVQSIKVYGIRGGFLY